MIAYGLQYHCRCSTILTVYLNDLYVCGEKADHNRIMGSIVILHKGYIFPTTLLGWQIFPLFVAKLKHLVQASRIGVCVLHRYYVHLHSQHARKHVRLWQDLPSD